jgi:hypothetical protein
MRKPSYTHTTGDDIFSLTDRRMADKDRVWERRLDIWRDGARWMVSKTSGFTAHVTATAQDCNNGHFITSSSSSCPRKRFEKALKTS